MDDETVIEIASDTEVWQLPDISVGNILIIEELRNYRSSLEMLTEENWLLEYEVRTERRKTNDHVNNLGK